MEKGYLCDFGRVRVFFTGSVLVLRSLSYFTESHVSFCKGGRKDNINNSLY